jgi:hypothetical protein
MHNIRWQTAAFHEVDGSVDVVEHVEETTAAA